MYVVSIHSSSSVVSRPLSVWPGVMLRSLVVWLDTGVTVGWPPPPVGREATAAPRKRQLPLGDVGDSPSVTRSV